MGINPISLKGNWKEGFALDKHTISSKYLGEDEWGHAQFNTKRSEIGQLVYQLKYDQNKNIINEIMKLISPFLLDWKIANKVDAVIPVPPSKKDRSFQPVYELSNCIAYFINKPVIITMLFKNSNIQIKGISNNEKHKSISGTITRNDEFSKKVNVLIIDDLYKTGETLSEVVNVLKTDPNVYDIYVLTMTKTRR